MVERSETHRQVQAMRMSDGFRKSSTHPTALMFTCRFQLFDVGGRNGVQHIVFLKYSVPRHHDYKLRIVERPVFEGHVLIKLSSFRNGVGKPFTKANCNRDDNNHGVRYLSSVWPLACFGESDHCEHKENPKCNGDCTK